MSVSPEISGEWFDFADQDVRVARAALEQDLGLESVAFHVQQAVEKHLKGFLISRGWELVKTHHLPVLLEEAEAREGQFTQFTGLCERADTYFRLHYPPALRAELRAGDLQADLAEVEQLARLVRGLVLGEAS